MAGLWGYGAQFQYDSDGLGTFVTVANVTTVNGMDLSRNTDDVTAHDSPDGWMEFIGTLKDGGEVSLDINYRPSDHDTLSGQLDDEAARNYRVIVPSNPQVTWSFAAIMTGFSFSLPTDGRSEGTLTFKVTGKPTFA